MSIQVLMNSKLRNYIAFTLGLLCIVSVSSIFASDFGYYRYRMWNSRDGLPQNSVNSIIQSQKGYIWFTTYEGLVRFDGKRFKIFNSKNFPEQMTYDRLYGLAEDKNEVIWAASEEGGLYEIKPDGHIRYHKLPNPSYIKSLVILDDGAVLLGTSNGVLKFENDELSPWFDEQLSKRNINKIIKRTDGTIWICTNKGLYKTDKSTGKLFLEPQTELKSILDVSFYDDRSGVIIIDNDIYRFEERKFKKINLPIGLKVPLSLLKDSEDNIWIGTNGFGLWFWNKEEIIDVNKELQIEPDVISYLATDDEKNIWVGTNGGGILKLTKGVFKVIGKLNGLNHPVTWSVSEDNSHSVWVGTYNGISKIEPNSIKKYYLSGVSSQHVWTVLYTKKEGVIAATNANSLFQYNSKLNTFLPFRDLPPIGSNIHALLEDSNGDIFVGAEMGLAKWDGKNWKKFGRGNQLSTIKTLFLDTDNSVLIGSNKGVFRIKNDSLDSNPIPGFDKIGVRYFSRTRSGALLIATEGYGLFVYQNKILTAITVKDGLYSNFISTAVEAKGSIWCSTNSGIFSISKTQLESFLADTSRKIRYQLYNELDGMHNSETNGSVYPNILADEYDTIWYPTMAGIAILNTRKAEVQKTILPRIYLDKVLVNGREVASDTSTIYLENNESQLTLSFSVVHFSSPERFKFAYKLNKNSEWNQLNSKPEVVLNEISTGEKTVYFSISNQEGIAVKELEIKIYKAPHFTESILFYVILISIGIALGYILYRLRIIQHKRNQTRLNQLISERTQALELEKEKSERALFKLAQANELLKNANKMKNDFLSIAAHDLKNPLSGIMGFSDLLIEEFDKNDRSKQMAIFIQKSSEKMLEMIERLLEQGKMNEALMSLKFSKVDLSEIAWSAASEFFPLAKKKMQRIVLSMADHTFIYADSFWIRECLDNLISNALKYSPIGSEVDVRTILKNEEVWLEVEDAGPGIAKEDQTKIFEAYKRLDHKTTGGETSTGLGLSIVKRVVDQHHGKIEIESELGSGTLFRIILPLHNHEAAKETLHHYTD